MERDTRSISVHGFWCYGGREVSGLFLIFGVGGVAGVDGSELEGVRRFGGSESEGDGAGGL